MTKTPPTGEEEDLLAGAQKAYERLVEKLLEQGREEGRQQAREEGHKQGLAEGRKEAASAVRRTFFAVYSSRFGTCPRAISEIVESTSDIARLADWLMLAATRSAEEIARELGTRST